MAAAGGVWIKGGTFVPAGVIASFTEETGYIKGDLKKSKESEYISGYLVQHMQDMMAQSKATPTVTDVSQKSATEYKKYPNDAYEIHGMLQPHFQDWYNGLTPAEKWAIREYVDGKYSAVNQLLRSGKFNPDAFQSSAVTNVVKQLDGMIAKSPGLPEPTMLYRGFSSADMFQAAMSGAVKPGSVITENQFLSTSHKYGTAAQSFLGHATYPVFYRIRAPQGARGAYTTWSALNPHMHESEYVLPRGSQFRVVGTQITKVGSHHSAAVYDVELVQ